MKVILLKLLGHKVHESAYVGFSYLNVKDISLAENTYIGFGNIFTNLGYLELEAGAHINRWNRVTTPPGHFGRLVVGERSAITLRHYFAISDIIQVGHDTLIAGHRSTFITHSKGIEHVDYVKPILIGDWCYLGSNLSVVPGTKVGSYCFVGMGTVLRGDLSHENYCLLAGNPVSVRRRLPEKAPYFMQGPLTHHHTKAEELGG